MKPTIVILFSLNMLLTLATATSATAAVGSAFTGWRYQSQFSSDNRGVTGAVKTVADTTHTNGDSNVSLNFRVAIEKVAGATRGLYQVGVAFERGPVTPCGITDSIFKYYIERWDYSTNQADYQCKNVNTVAYAHGTHRLTVRRDDETGCAPCWSAFVSNGGSAQTRVQGPNDLGSGQGTWILTGYERSDTHFSSPATAIGWFGCGAAPFAACNGNLVPPLRWMDTSDTYHDVTSGLVDTADDNLFDVTIDDYPGTGWDGCPQPAVTYSKFFVGGEDIC